MSHPTAGVEGGGLPPHAPIGESSVALATDEITNGGGGALAVGRRWRAYTIKSEIAGSPVGCFLATDVSVMADVVLQARRISDASTDMRRQVWSVLQQLPEKNFARAVDSHEEDDFRYEIFAVPPGQSLREWLGAHRTDVAMIEAVVQQLAQGIEALHQAGLVHLDLRPETVFVDEEESQLTVLIGGLQRAQPLAQRGLGSIEVNPYYAPPEAGGLFRHEGGDGLRAWDWWALGRIVQEMVLGRHVYGLVMERDVRTNPPELRPRAEALLLERDSTALRAGAVELLPADTGSRLRLLLRGLLASVREGRWRWREVQAWVRGEPLSDRYDLPRNAQLIRRGERYLTLHEIADLYSQPEQFAAGVDEIFPAEGVSDSVWNILQETPQFRVELDQVRALREMMAMPPWEGKPIRFCQAAVAGLVWLTLAAPNLRRPLCFDQHMINGDDLRRLFRHGAPEAAEAILAVLTAEPYLQRVAPLDSAAKKALDLLAKAGRDAVAKARAVGWACIARPDGLARILAWTLASDAELQASRADLRAKYATSDDPHLDAWLRASSANRVELSLLAVTGEHPEQHGYVTHAAWSRRRHADLLARALKVSRASFWRKLERTVACTPAFLGFWPVSALIWLVPIALAVAAHAWFAAAFGAVAATAGRLVGTLAIRRAIERHAPGSLSWRWTDRAPRCGREVLALLPGETDTLARHLDAELARIRQDLAELKLPPDLPQPPEPARLSALSAWSAVALISPAMALALVAMSRHEISGDVSSSTGAAAAHAAASPAPVEPDSLVEIVGADGTVGLYEIVDDGFGGRRRGPLKQWDVPKPATPTSLAVTGQAPASSAQRAFVAVSAELLLAPYPKRGRNVLLAVPVPHSADGQPSIILYDSATGRLADGWSYRVGSELTPSTWYTVTGREVVYLGLAGGLKREDLIPLP